MIGRTISHYKIIEKLGGGGMGVVYKAEDLKLDRFVALKFLPPELTRDEESKQRFIHEAKAASSLQHNNICTIHDIDETEELPGVAGGQLFICMDYYNGETLKKKIERGPLKIDDAIDITIQIAEGLVKAHESDIIHRDIKPANIFITNDGVVKILDFGLAKVIGQTQLTQMGSTVGTVSYMSPEQTRGEQVDHRTDIWSIGVVLYEMITGQQPFKGDYEQAVTYSIINEEPEPLTGLRTGVPKELERIVNKTLSKNSEERYHHIDEMITDLRRIQKSLDDKTRPHSKEYKKEKNFLHSPILWSSLAILLIIVVLLWIFFSSNTIAFSERDWILITDFDNRTGEQVFSGTINEALTIALQQSRYVNVFTKSRINESLKRMEKDPSSQIDESLGKEICLREGIKAMMVGNINRIGDIYSISAQIINPATGDALISERIEVKGQESVLEAVDKLNKHIRKNLGESLASIEELDKPLAKVTTSSLSALNYYTIGEDHKRKAEWDQAIPFYKRAINIDSSFGIAYSKVAAIYHNMGNIIEALKYSKLAMDWVSHVTEREKYYITGEFYRIRDDYKNAIETYKFLSTLYPDDFTAHNNLAFIYQSTRQYEDAVRELRELERLAPKTWYFYQIMGLNYCGMGKFDEAIEHFNQALEVSPTQYWSNVGLGMAYLMKDMREESKVQFEKLITQDDNWKSIGEEWLGIINLYIGKNEQALSHFQNSRHIYQRIERKSAEAWTYVMESDIFRRKGDSKACLDALKKSEKNWPTGRMKTELGIAYTSFNNFKAAENILQELEKLASEEKTQKNLAYFNWLKGEIDYNRGNYFEALRNLESAKSLLDELDIRVSLSKAYVKTKNYGKAIAGYKYIQNHQYATLFDAYPTLWPLSHYWLGQIYEQTGDTSEAINYYQKFLHIWREADKDLPELIDAKKRLTKLESVVVQ